ncbi:uncharacterized protein [Littorina saxatilis]|uniref:uncharacterized protein n=1 Tax=Littorina saxatilis TaxID=31220 RepID=UPI0038B5F5C7
MNGLSLSMLNVYKPCSYVSLQSCNYCFFLSVFLVVSCALTLLTAEAVNARKGKRKGKNGKSKGDRKKHRRPQVKRFLVCPLNQTCDDANGCGKTTDDTNRANLIGLNAAPELQATIYNLEELNISLKELVDEKSFGGKDDVYPGYGTKELNPMDKTKLSSDKQFKLLGQMTWWLTWMEASLRILQEIRLRVEAKGLNADDIIPTATDGTNNRKFTIDSTLENLKKVKGAVNDLHFKLGHDMDTKAKNSPFRCHKVRVMLACRKNQDPNCSAERDRAYIVLRDAHKAADKMLKALRECKVVGKGEGFALDCKRNVIFYQKKCQKTLCGMQKKRCKCISWTYE